VGAVWVAVWLLPAYARAGGASSPCHNEASRVGPSATLPDCRVYEQVSPAEKGGTEAVPTNLALAAQASPGGEAIAYLGNGSYPGGSGNTPLFDARLSTRGPAGWETTEVTPQKTSSGPPGNYSVAYAFSEDLAQTVVDVPLQELASGATPGMYNLFLRSPLGSYSLVDSLPPIVPPPGTCSEKHEPYCYTEVDLNAFAGASQDFEDILFESTAQYEPQAPAEVESLYESALEGGQRVVRLVGYLPSGQAAEEGSRAGGGSYAEVEASVEAGRLEHAISANGSRVVFEAAANGAEAGEAGQAGDTEVYDRVEHATTVELSAPSPGAEPADKSGQPAQYWAASSDGSRVFFTSDAELTSESNTGGDTGADLYEYDFDAPPGTAALRDLSLDAGEAAGARVLGVVGSSEGGEYVYFVAEGVLAGGIGADGHTPAAGEPNLYVVHEREAPVFIATLSKSDARDWTAVPSEDDGQLESYVAPGGGDLAFTSVVSLPTANFGSAYDNLEGGAGAAASEVYEYLPPNGKDGATGRLDCASCGASEGPPSGAALLGGVAEAPGNPPVLSSSGTPFRQPRALSEDGGRLFFTAPDAAGSRGVYEYESDGEGSCSESASCTFAISQPPAGAQDFFLDASASGEDVFFGTVSKLVPGDEDTLYDVYDARVEGVSAPTAPPVCEANCRGTGESSIETPPISSNTIGPSENVPPRQAAIRKAAPPKHAGKAKAKSKRKRKAALRSKRKRKAALRSKRKRKAALRSKGRGKQAKDGKKSDGRARRRGDGRRRRRKASREQRAGRRGDPRSYLFGALTSQGFAADSGALRR
jgi:hypothetical protein